MSLEVKDHMYRTFPHGAWTSRILLMNLEIEIDGMNEFIAYNVKYDNNEWKILLRISS